MARLSRAPFHKRNTSALCLMAGELGFEPRLTESESAVLPLNYSPLARQIAVKVQLFNMDETDK